MSQSLRFHSVFHAMFLTKSKLASLKNSSFLIDILLGVSHMTSGVMIE